MPTSRVPAVAAKAKVMMRTQKRGVLTISPGVRSPKVPGMCATLGGLEALGQPTGLGGLQEQGGGGDHHKEDDAERLKGAKDAQARDEQRGEHRGRTAGPAVEAARVMPEARPFLSMNHFWPVVSAGL